MNYDFKRTDGQQTSRMKNHLGEQEVETGSVGVFTAIDLSEPTATEDATTTQPPVDAPESPATKSKKAGGKEKKGKKDTAEPVDKDKYSIYLPKEMSQSLRMAYVVTGRKFSHLAEEALEDMLYHKYQCHEKSCTCRFSMEAGAKVPTRCPVCGGNKISPVKYR